MAAPTRDAASSSPRSAASMSALRAEAVAGSGSWLAH